MTIKVNGMTISVENTNVAYDYKDIEKDSIAIESMSNNINKSIEALNIISNIKAVESFGYKSTEGVGENIKKAANTVWAKIKEFFKKIAEWCVKAFKWIKKKILVLYKKIKYRKLKSSNNVFDKFKYKIIIKRAEAGKEAYIDETYMTLNMTEAEANSLTNAVNTYIHYFDNVRRSPHINNIESLDNNNKGIIKCLNEIKKFGIDGSPEDLGKLVEEIKQYVDKKNEWFENLNFAKHLNDDEKLDINQALDELRRIGFTAFKDTYNIFMKRLDRYIASGNDSIENSVKELESYCEQQLAILGQNNNSDYMKTNESKYSKNIKYKYNTATYVQSTFFKDFKLINFMQEFCNATIRVDDIINNYFYKTVTSNVNVLN